MAATSPISGSVVTLYEANSSSGVTATSLATATSDAQGRFSVSFANPGGCSVLYLVAVGGNAGNGPNSAIQLTTVLGPASELPTGAVIINEVTSVGTAYTMNFFIQPLADNSIAGSPPAPSNAAQTLFALVDPASGAVRASLDAGAQNMINGLADIMGSCTQGTASACSTLFSSVAPIVQVSGPIAPTDSFGAMLQIVQNPTFGVSTLWALIGSSPSYPTATTAPSNLAIALTFSGAGIKGTEGIALDPSGNLWVANFSNSSVTEIPAGASSCASGCTNFSGGGMSKPFAVAGDLRGNIWIANSGNSSVTEIPKGAISCANACIALTGGGISVPDAIAVDAIGNIWVANGGNNSVTGIPNGSTSCANCANFASGSGIDQPVAIAVDAFGNLWVTNGGGTNSITIILTGEGFTSCFETAGCLTGTGGGIASPYGIAIDPLASTWIANSGSNSVTKMVAGQFTCPTTNSLCTQFVGGGISVPQGITSDASGNIWVTNAAGVSGSGITKIPTQATDCSLCVNLSGGGINQPFGVAVDGAGSLWIANRGADTVMEFVGVASPTSTPLVGAPTPPQ